MNIVIPIIVVVSAVMSLIVILFVINILQKGGCPKGLSIKDILGCEPKDATKEKIYGLNKAQVMQLFYAADAPELMSLHGEYDAETLPVGIMSASADFFTHKIFGPGRWLGKAFTSNDSDQGWGYNLFKKENKTLRTRKFITYVKNSKIDDGQSFFLEYQPYNKGTVRSMKDEIRKINDTLFICVGYMNLGGGSINPAPFILHGSPQPFQQVDEG